MSARVLIWVGLGATVVALTASAAGPRMGMGTESAEIRARFDHGQHDRAFQRMDVACTDCHRVGAAPADLEADYADIDLSAPWGACHTCHSPSDGSRPIGPSRCDTCHEVVDAPPTHGAGWLALHGAEARMSGQTCESCHQQRFCVECHTQKDRQRFRVHDGAWMSVHGIAARTDPASCTTCHLQADCTSCHVSGTPRMR